MRSQFAARIHRLAVTFAPLLPVAIAMFVVLGKRW